MLIDELKNSGTAAASMVLCLAAESAKNRGELLSAVSLYARALPGLSQVISDSAYLGLVHLNMAECLEMLERHDEAALHAKRVAQILRVQSEKHSLAHFPNSKLTEHPNSRQ